MPIEKTAAGHISNYIRETRDMRARYIGDLLKTGWNTVMGGWAGFGIITLLLIASSAYLAFGGPHALEPSLLPEPETSRAEVAVMAADTGGAPRTETASDSSAKAPDYLPAGYLNRGPRGDGNVMTYEHD